MLIDPARLRPPVTHAAEIDAHRVLSFGNAGDGRDCELGKGGDHVAEALRVDEERDGGEIEPRAGGILARGQRRLGRGHVGATIRGAGSAWYGRRAKGRFPAMSDAFLIYGATGYTGRLLARAARERGMRPILGGRNEARLAAIAGALGLEHRAADLGSLAGSLRDVAVVVNAAGPFVGTFGPVIDACLQGGAHYLDLSGEVISIEGVARRGPEARARGLMLMPSVGFDVVPSDCLALHVSRRLRRPVRLRMGVTGLEVSSRGSLRTVASGIGQSVQIRRGGALVDIAPGSLQRSFDFGEGTQNAFALSWGDVATAWYTTGIGDIEVYYEAIAPLRLMTAVNQNFAWLLGTPAGRRWLDLHIDMLPEGPTDAQRAFGKGVIVAEAEDASGRVARARVRTPEAYTFTCATTLAIVERVLGGDVEAGFQTPARVYGADFVTRFSGVIREDLEG
ncbi:MAG: saccharopine dehydrogenase NADP-binding domain-containing protein [Minicystis sp.]